MLAARFDTEFVVAASKVLDERMTCTGLSGVWVPNIRPPYVFNGF
jgi:hypothetical protein